MDKENSLRITWTKMYSRENVTCFNVLDYCKDGLYENRGEGVIDLRWFDGLPCFNKLTSLQEFLTRRK